MVLLGSRRTPLRRMVPRTSAAADAVDLVTFFLTAVFFANLESESLSFKIIDQIKRSKMKGGDTTRVFASIGAKPMVYLASGMQLALMAVSYTTYAYLQPSLPFYYFFLFFFTLQNLYSLSLSVH